ncbi:HD family phosphohydrolase [Blattabacterium cuenoti]|uniref:HD family phosphohydrolase n=1 Tax=Blattabacterium cuenoti TaxID=1653831 RepID=UPI00163D1438|nr:HDIG domain-containing metalloprotein [Blattabacterium cuenoti]
MIKLSKFYTKKIKNKIIIIIAILLLTFSFPKKKIFKYEFYKGDFWLYEDLFSPFNFIISKNSQDIYLEITKLKNNQDFYFDKNKNFVINIKKKLKKFPFIRKNKLFYKKANKIINKVYKYGYINYHFFLKKNTSIFYRKEKNKKDWTFISSNKIYTLHKVNNLIKKEIPIKYDRKFLRKTLKKIIVPNLYYNKNYTEEILFKKIKSTIKIKRLIKKGEKIIQKNEIIDRDKFHVLSLFKKKYESIVWNKKKEYGTTIGYFLIISTIFFILFLYIFYFQNKIFKNIKKINFLIINILLISFITILTLKFHSKILYSIPFCILPISVRAFFNLNLSLIFHLTTILLLSIITPHRFEFIFLQIVTGFLVLLTKKNLYKRENLFLSVIKIFIVYIITFSSLSLIREGTFNITKDTLSLFFFSGILTLFVHPLIFLFEKLFNFTSDISLLELSNINTPVLRLLSKKAPGTLQHVLTVANIAEEAAFSIGANSLLARIGAIYHDLGKIENSHFFIENQQNTIINPHEKLSPKESANIILKHVTIGIKFAKKYHLPDTITDFIRTHHGNSILHFFYEKQKKKYPNMKINEKQFQYSGPKPFSKETAIVMICDSVEAASKSIKNPSNHDLKNVVEDIINKQKKENQFSNADITMKEIEKIKKVLQKKLINIYHTRIVYPNS